MRAPKPETLDAMRAVRVQLPSCGAYLPLGEAAAVADRMVADTCRELCERIAGELRDLAASLDQSAGGCVREIADALDPEGGR